MSRPHDGVLYTNFTPSMLMVLILTSTVLTSPNYPRVPTLLLLTVVLLWVLQFFPTIPPLGGGMPPVMWQRQNIEI